MPRLYPRMIEGLTVSGKAELLLMPDPLRRGISLVQCEKADLVVNQLGKKVLNQSGGGNSKVKSANYGIDMGDVGMLGITAMAITPEGGEFGGRTDITIRVLRTVDADPTPVTEGDRATASWPDAVDPRFRAIVRDRINLLAGSGHWDKASDFRLYLGASAANNAINLRDPFDLQAVYLPGAAGITTLPYKHVQGGGSDARINTGRTAADCLVSTDDIVMMARAGVGVDNSGNITGFASNAGLQPNRSNTELAIRSGGGLDVIPSGGPGKTVAYRRTESTNYDYFIEGVKGNMVRPSTTLPPERVLHDLALGASTADGYTSATTVPLRMRMVGRGAGFTDSAIAAWNAAFAAIAATADLIYAELHP